eukprot:jgi/Hompol1/3400/HPOL_006509-RA
MITSVVSLAAIASSVLAQGNVPGVPCKDDYLVDPFTTKQTALFPGETVPRQVNPHGGFYSGDGVDFNIDTNRHSILLTVTKPTDNFWSPNFEGVKCFDLRPYTAIQFSIISAAGSDSRITLTEMNPDCTTRNNTGDSGYVSISKYITPDGTNKTITIPLTDLANGGAYDFKRVKDLTFVGMKAGYTYEVSNIILKGSCAAAPSASAATVSATGTVVGAPTAAPAKGAASSLTHAGFAGSLIAAAALLL